MLLVIGSLGFAYDGETLYVRMIAKTFTDERRGVDVNGRERMRGRFL